MHSKGTPQNMDSCAIYDNLLKEMIEWFERKIKECMDIGIPRWNIIIDPGFGFAKTEKQNIEILKNLKEIKRFGFPVLVGFSNKRFVKINFGKDLTVGNSSLAIVSVEKGADIIRIHDKEIVKAIELADKIYKNSS